MQRFARLLTKDIDADSIRAALGSYLPASERIERELLLRQCAQALGFSRLSKKLRSRLNKTIGAEVRYGRIQVDSDWRYLWRQMTPLMGSMRAELTDSDFVLQ